MIKRKDIIDNRKFIGRCEYYGLDYRKFKIYGEVIIVNTFDDKFRILFDKNFNIINILKRVSVDDFKEPKMSYCVEREYYHYCIFPIAKIELENGFEYMTTKQIVNLANRITLRKEYGNQLGVKIVDTWQKITPEQEHFFQMISYFKFLGEEIEKFIMANYSLALIMDNNTLNIRLFLQSLIERINEYIELCIKNNEKPTPEHLFSYLGKYNLDEINRLLLNDIIELVLTKYEYVFDDKTNKFKKAKSNKQENYRKIYHQLIEIANLTEEDIQEMREERISASMEASREISTKFLQNDLKEKIKKEINFYYLTTDEKALVNILQSIVGKRRLSYGYSEDNFCLGKVNDEWFTYFVDRGEIFNLQKFDSLYKASCNIIKDVSENEEEYNKLINKFNQQLEEFINDFNDITSQESRVLDELVPIIQQDSDIKSTPVEVEKSKVKVLKKK